MTKINPKFNLYDINNIPPFKCDCDKCKELRNEIQKANLSNSGELEGSLDYLSMLGKYVLSHIDINASADGSDEPEETQDLSSEILDSIKLQDGLKISFYNDDNIFTKESQDLSLVDGEAVDFIQVPEKEAVFEVEYTADKINKPVKRSEIDDIDVLDEDTLLDIIPKYDSEDDFEEIYMDDCRGDNDKAGSKADDKLGFDSQNYKDYDINMPATLTIEEDTEI